MVDGVFLLSVAAAAAVVVVLQSSRICVNIRFFSSGQQSMELNC